MFLAHGLQLADDFTDKAFLNQLLAEGSLQSNGHGAITLGGKALSLGHGNIHILGSQLHSAALELQHQLASAFQLCLGGMAIDSSQGSLDLANLLAHLRTQHLELRLEAIGEIFLHIRLELNVLQIQLAGHNLLEELVQFPVSLYIHVANRLAVLDVGSVASSTAQYHDFQHQLHLCLQLGINHCLVSYREVAEMYGNRRTFIHAAYQVAVNALGDKRHHRCRQLHHSGQCRVQGHVGINLVLSQLLAPETLTAAAHIPVGQLIHKILQHLGSLSYLVACQIAINSLNQGIQAGQHPLVHDRQLVVFQLILGGIKIVNIGIQHIEGIGIPQGAHELALAFLHRIIMEAVWQPRCAVLIEIPADSICTMLSQGIHRVNGIALGFAHLLAVLVLHMPQHDDILVGGIVKEQSGNRQQGIEPATGLVHSLGDEVRRITLLKNLLVLKRIMPLGERHGAGIEPAVNNFRHALHLAAALRALDGYGINVRTMQLNILRAVI